MAALGNCLRKTAICGRQLGIFKRVYLGSVYSGSEPGCPGSWLTSGNSVYNIQPVRCKGTKRLRLPPTEKSKEKWQPKKKVDASEAMSPKELKEFLERVPADDVWIQKYYPPAKYTFEQAIAMHRELAVPEMQNNMDGLLFIDADLDLSTKKKTKFLGVLKGNVLLPHNVDDSIQSRVVVITKTEEDKEKAAKLGAVFVGGLDVIRMIEKGDIKQDDFDHVVLNSDMSQEAVLIKKGLKDRYPSKKKGNLGTDIEAMVRLFVYGRSYETLKLSDAVGKLSFTFGKLNMDLELLKENFKAVVQVLAEHKPASTGGPIFSKVRIRCPPSSEAFLVDDETVLPEGTMSQLAPAPVKPDTPQAKEADDSDNDEEAEKASN